MNESARHSQGINLADEPIYTHLPAIERSSAAART
jgi:hypothetical protein